MTKKYLYRRLFLEMEKKKAENKVPLQTYFETIKKKTGKTPADFKELAITQGYFENGIMKPTVKAGEVIAWLKKDFDLGHGHSLALYHSFKD